MAIEDVETYYNTMATDYEESMFGWGYCMPEAIADALVKHGGLKMDSSVLDLGCGNGLCGQALLNRGLEDLNGIDFSRSEISLFFGSSGAERAKRAEPHLIRRMFGAIR